VSIVSVDLGVCLKVKRTCHNASILLFKAVWLRTPFFWDIKNTSLASRPLRMKAPRPFETSGTCNPVTRCHPRGIESLTFHYCIMFCGMLDVELRGLFHQFSELSNDPKHPFHTKKRLAAPDWLDTCNEVFPFARHKPAVWPELQHSQIRKMCWHIRRVKLRTRNFRRTEI